MHFGGHTNTVLDFWPPYYWIGKYLGWPKSIKECGLRHMNPLRKPWMELWKKAAFIILYSDSRS